MSVNIRHYSQRSKAHRGLALVQVLLLLVTLLLAVGVGYLILHRPADEPLIKGTDRAAVDVPSQPPAHQASPPSMTTFKPQNVAAISSQPIKANPAPEANAEPSVAPVQQPKRPVLITPTSSSNLLGSDSSLPSLDNSDRSFRQSLAQLDSSQVILDWLIDEELIRKFVVTVDNMVAGKIPRKHSPLRPMADKFRPSVKGEQIWLDGYNFSRYNSYLGLLEQIDSQNWVEIYRRYYPLMQQAYAELGYPRQQFHDRVLKALDHLLAAPVKPRALALAQPSVMFVYADPQIEQLSAVHKQMLRIGPVNAARVMELAAVLRAELERLEAR